MKPVRLTTDAGMAVNVSACGGIITALEVPTRDGDMVNVVRATDRLPYCGAIVGRCANRIRNARFTLNNVEHRLTVNEPPNHLHGGLRGFDKVVWQVSTPESSVACVELSHRSPDGDEGYPGELFVTVRYSLVPPGDLRIDYEMRAGALDTIANLTNHSYFNLNGTRSRDILDHDLQIFADSYLPLAPDCLPTGEIRALEGTDLDFRRTLPIGPRLPLNYCYVLNKGTDGLARAARVSSAKSGLCMEVWTTEPGLQLYTVTDALCLEAQGFPDAVNQPHFPSVVLPGGKIRRSTTIYRFRA